MKFTSKDLMKAMGLSIGDRIKYNDQIWSIEKSEECQGAWIGFTDGNRWFNIDSLINAMDFEILPRPKRVGDTLCKDCECVECHLRCLPYCNQLDNGKKTLFNTLNSWNEYDTFDQEIHDLLKARLDKEVKE